MYVVYGLYWVGDGIDQYIEVYEISDIVEFRLVPDYMLLTH